jgi:hypothetical protein
MPADQSFKPSRAHEVTGARSIAVSIGSWLAARSRSSASIRPRSSRISLKICPMLSSIVSGGVDKPPSSEAEADASVNPCAMYASRSVRRTRTRREPTRTARSSSRSIQFRTVCGLSVSVVACPRLGRLQGTWRHLVLLQKPLALAPARPCPTAGTPPPWLRGPRPGTPFKCVHRSARPCWPARRAGSLARR